MRELTSIYINDFQLVFVIVCVLFHFKRTSYSNKFEIDQSLRNAGFLNCERTMNHKTYSFVRSIENINMEFLELRIFEDNEKFSKI